MESYEFLVYLAVILISTKVFGIFSRRVHMPAVVGALTAGIILGPSVLNLISLEGDNGIFLNNMAELGVILLMFNAGLETDLKELKKNGKASAIIACLGVLLPLIGGFGVYLLFFSKGDLSTLQIMRGIFIGVVLTATSVSITVETLRELGKFRGKVGCTILGAAIIDDILGIIVLTIVTSMQGSETHPAFVMMKIFVYFIFMAMVAFIVSRFRHIIEMEDNKRRTVILAVSFCFILAFLSEEFFEIADITGAYFAGLMLCNMKVSAYIKRRVEIPSYLIFSPIFFASIGFKTSLSGMSPYMILFSLALLIVAILTKVLGCGAGARICGYRKRHALEVGVGMISRGEVALIVAQKGYSYGLLSDSLFAPIVFVVIVTTLLTPILLKIVMKKDPYHDDVTENQKATL